MHPEEIKSSRQARAKRLKRLRKITGLSRQEFTKRYGISRGTMQNWETARFGGLTEKGAKLVLGAFRSEGVHCSFEWLMYGVGLGPQLSESLYGASVGPNETTQTPQERAGSEDEVIAKELEKFKQLNVDTIDMIVEDDGMLPLYQTGERVAGRKYYGKDIDRITDRDCVVETQSGQVMLRYLRAGSRSGVYSLVCVNPKTSVATPIQYDVSLASAAPVVWMRRKDVSE